MTITRHRALAAAVAAAALTGCTTGQLSMVPNTTFTPANGKLFVAVGTANIDGEADLNVVATFRSPNGLSAIPISSATIAGPAGFIGPSGSGDPGADLTTVPLGSALNNFVLQSGLTGGQTTNLAGIDSYGVGPVGTSQQNVPENLYPAQPQFGDVSAGSQAAFGVCGSEIPIYGGAPAYPGQLQPNGPPGFPEGFYLVASGAPPAGTYNLVLSYSQNGTTTNVPGSVSLSSTALLPTLAAPTYTSDGNGGGSGTVNVPAGVTEVLVNVLQADPNHGCFPGDVYASVEVKGSGSQPYTIPSGTFATGSSIVVQAIGFDYNAVELGPPQDMSQNPGLPAQADVTVSPELLLPSEAKVHHHALVHHQLKTH